MRNFVSSAANAACVLLYMASMAVVLGAVASIYTHRLRDGLLVALGAFVFASAGFGYSAWRTYKSRRRPSPLRPSSA